MLPKEQTTFLYAGLPFKGEFLHGETKYTCTRMYECVCQVFL